MTMAALLPDPPPATFRYVLPSGPVAGTAVDIGHVAVTIGLLLVGELEVMVGPGPEDGLRGAALSALGIVAKGVMIRGLGSATPSISAAAGHRFTQQHHDFRAPNTVTSTGDCDVDFTHQHDGVPASVRGQLTYSLEVTAERPPSATAPQGWFRRHEKELASIGLLLLVAVPIAPERLEKSPV
jgi:hypothetical protein